MQLHTAYLAVVFSWLLSATWSLPTQPELHKHESAQLEKRQLVAPGLSEIPPFPWDFLKGLWAVTWPYGLAFLSGGTAAGAYATDVFLAQIEDRKEERKANKEEQNRRLQEVQNNPKTLGLEEENPPTYRACKDAMKENTNTLCKAENGDTVIWSPQPDMTILPLREICPDCTTIPGDWSGDLERRELFTADQPAQETPAVEETPTGSQDQAFSCPGCAQETPAVQETPTGSQDQAFSCPGCAQAPPSDFPPCDIYPSEQTWGEYLSSWLNWKTATAGGLALGAAAAYNPIAEWFHTYTPGSIPAEQIPIDAGGPFDFNQSDHWSHPMCADVKPEDLPAVCCNGDHTKLFNICPEVKTETVVLTEATVSSPSVP